MSRVSDHLAWLPLPRPLAVFISSTFDEFREARELIADELLKHDIRACVYEHETGAEPGVKRDAAYRVIEECDIFVALFAQRLGEGTASEHLQAKRQAKPCLVYVRKAETDRNFRPGRLAAARRPPCMGGF